MTKFSDFIRAPGSAGPPTRQGIQALGFLLAGDLPPAIAGFLSLLVAQPGFTGPQRAQGRTNLGLGSIATQDANAVNITGGSVAGITDLAIADGGTGASTAATARTNLGLGTIATQNANAVNITGGTIAGITDLALADGGTGASNAADARTNLGLGSIATQAASAVNITGGFVKGAVAQVQVLSLNTAATGTTTIPADDTIPQVTEGTSFVSGVFTPQYATSKLEFEIICFASASVSGVGISAALFETGVANALGAAYVSQLAGYVHNLSFIKEVVAGSTTPRTYQLRVGPGSAATVTVNGSGGSRILGGALETSIRITEIMQ